MDALQQLEVSRRRFVGGLLVSGFMLVLPGGSRAASRFIRIRDLYNRDLSFSTLAGSLENTMHGGSYYSQWIRL